MNKLTLALCCALIFCKQLFIENQLLMSDLDICNYKNN